MHAARCSHFHDHEASLEPNHLSLGKIKKIKEKFFAERLALRMNYLSPKQDKREAGREGGRGSETAATLPTSLHLPFSIRGYSWQRAPFPTSPLPPTSAWEKHHAKLVPRNKRCRECSCKATIEVEGRRIRAAAFPCSHLQKTSLIRHPPWQL